MFALKEVVTHLWDSIVVTKDFLTFEKVLAFST